MLNDEFQKVLPQAGCVEWIGLSSERRSQIESVDSAEIQAGTGLVGDHHAKSGRSKRQVTLIQAEHLEVVGSLLGKAGAVDPMAARRNIVVRGINLQALRNGRFRIGENVVLEGTGPCAPCSRMEENLGEGGYQAMRGHGGITTIVIEGGQIEVGDTVQAEQLGKDPEH